jgi:hypothetical protein
MDLSRLKLYFAITALIVAVGSFVCGIVGFSYARFTIFDIALWGSAFALLLGSVTFIISSRTQRTVLYVLAVIILPVPLVTVLGVIRTALWCSTFAFLLCSVTFLISLRAQRTVRYALAAIILSLPLVTVLGVIRYSMWARQKIEREHTLLYNMKLLRKSLQHYVEANDGYLPDANSWADSLMKEDPSLDLNSFRHPEDPDVRVAYNVNLSGLKFSNISQNVVLFFPAEGGHNLAGAQELLDSMTQTNNKSMVRIMLLNGWIREYRPEHHGVPFNGKTFVAVPWIPGIPALINTAELTENEGQP